MKTVSWYLHSCQMLIDRLVVVTPDREQHELSFGKALNEYGHLRVSSVVISDGTFTIIL